MILAVLDTNVFVAAIGWRGASCRMTPCPSGRRNTGPEARLTGRPEVCPTLRPEQLHSFFSASTRCDRKNAFISAPAADRSLTGSMNSFSEAVRTGAIPSVTPSKFEGQTEWVATYSPAP